MPLYPSKSGATLQSVFSEITVDTTTGSLYPSSYVTLLTTNIVTGANYIRVLFTCSSDNSNAANLNYFRIMIDGVLQKGTSVRMSAANVAHSAAVSSYTLVTEGAHVVTLQWCVSAITGRIRPVTNPNRDHASMLVQEISG